MTQRAGACAGSTLAAVLLVAGCTTGAGVSAPTSGAPVRTAVAPDGLSTPVDPGPPPLAPPARTAGEVARLVVRAQGPGKTFDVVPGEPVLQGHTYLVEAACSAHHPSDLTSYAVYDAAPGTWGRLEPIYSQPFACDGQVHRTSHLGLPAGRLQVDVRGLPRDAVTAYALIRPE
ncbi:MAG TPA: hypothetical protein VHK64_06330 [Nocardioidaceae bacterium]|nr:hypothetical protein [Nocardioidaceae bacterium]